jgi:hypothetical protein
MDINELKDKCRAAGLLLHRCSEHHYQIADAAGVLTDVWPTTNKFRWHHADEKAKAQSGSAHQAVKAAIRTVRLNSEHGNSHLPEPATLPPAIKANGCPPRQEPAATASEIEALRADCERMGSIIRHRRHLLRLAAERLQFAGGLFDVALAQEIQNHLS